MERAAEEADSHPADIGFDAEGVGATLLDCRAGDDVEIELESGDPSGRERRHAEGGSVDELHGVRSEPDDKPTCRPVGSPTRRSS